MIRIYIDNEEVVSDKEFTIQEDILNTPSVILNNVYPKTWETDKDYTSKFYHPLDYSKCRIINEYTENDEVVEELLFCGVVKNSGNISLNPREPHYSTLQILSYKTFLSEGETLDYVIVNSTVEGAIERVIETIAPYGFEKGVININGSDDIIGAYSTKDKTAYDVFNYLADITQSKWMTRLIDEDSIAVDFYDPNLLPQGTQIEYTKEYFEQNLIDDISYSYSANDYRNKQVMTSDQIFGNTMQSQRMYATGYQTQFMTDILIGRIQSILVGGAIKTFATSSEKEQDVEADFYYTPGSNIFESVDTYSAGIEINITYTPIIEGRQVVTNNSEIGRITNSTGVKGIIARYENRNDTLTSSELQMIGQSYLRYKGSAEILLNVQTRSNLWNVGQRVQFNAPIQALNTEYLVKSKNITRVLSNPSSEEIIFYEFTLSSSFNSESAINYFDNQRAKVKGNIAEGESISRNIDIENTAQIIFYYGSATEIEVEGNSALQSTLSFPLNN